MKSPLFKGGSPRVQIARSLQRGVLVGLLTLAACGGGSSSDPADSPGTADSDARRTALASGALITDPGTQLVGEGSGESIYTEGAKLVRADATIGTLGPELFGDRVSLYTGALEFVQTEVTLPGHVPANLGGMAAPREAPKPPPPKPDEPSQGK